MRKDIENIVNKYIPEHHFNIRRKLAQDILGVVLVEKQKSSDKKKAFFLGLGWLQRIFYK